MITLPSADEIHRASTEVETIARVVELHGRFTRLLVSVTTVPE